jgi:hypothetical protein
MIPLMNVTLYFKGCNMGSRCIKLVSYLRCTLDSEEGKTTVFTLAPFVSATLLIFKISTLDTNEQAKHLVQERLLPFLKQIGDNSVLDTFTKADEVLASIAYVLEVIHEKRRDGMSGGEMYDTIYNAVVKCAKVFPDAGEIVNFFFETFFTQNYDTILGLLDDVPAR